MFDILMYLFENYVHSEFDPWDAPIWSVGVTFEESPVCLLGENFEKVNFDNKST